VAFYPTQGTSPWGGGGIYECLVGVVKKVLENLCHFSGVNVMKLFTDVSYDFSKLAGAFVAGKPFQPSLMFVGRSGTYPRVGQHLKGALLG
jgi:hypothetical protein